MMKALRANLSIAGMRQFFKHPADLNKHLHMSLDACHMLKRMRNTFADQVLLKYSQDQTMTNRMPSTREQDIENTCTLGTDKTENEGY